MWLLPDSLPGLPEAMNVLRFLNKATEFPKLLWANAGSALAIRALVSSMAERQESMVRVIILSWETSLCVWQVPILTISYGIQAGKGSLWKLSASKVKLGSSYIEV